MTAQQKKFWLVCGALFLSWYIYRQVNAAMQYAAWQRQQAARAAQQQRDKQKQKEQQLEKQKQKELDEQKKLAAKEKSSPLTSLSNLSGTWKGDGALSNRGLCTLKLELRETQTSGNYTGYSTLQCRNLPQLMQPKDRNRAFAVRNRMDPAAAILTGTSANGSVNFKVEKLIAPDASGCATTAFTVTPFGTNRIAVQWQEGQCQGGEILLSRQGK